LFEDRALRRIFAPRSNELRGGWEYLYNEELRELYSSPIIIRMITSRKM
jgi:hypothetical protein